MISSERYANSKIFFFLAAFIITVWPHQGISAQDLTNSKLVNYKFGRFDYSYYILIPDNLQKYSYLSHYPFTAFMFLYYYDEQKIANLTVKELKSHSLGGTYSCCTGDAFYDALKFDKLKGFEAVAEELTRLDEFQIAEKKKEIIAKLLEVYGKYKHEYSKYLKGIDGTYKFRKGGFRIPVWRKLKGYNNSVEVDDPRPLSYYDRININDYDLDNKIINIRMLSPISRRGSRGWEYYYIQKIKNKYENMNWQKNPILQDTIFPDKIHVPMAIDDAKRLFKGGDTVYCDTILTVKPDKGAFGYQGNAFFVMTSNFEIIKITKNYYKKENWSSKENKFIGGPTYSIEIRSNEKHPLH